MAVTEVPFDLLEVKLAAPVVRSGTVRKSDVITRLSSGSEPIAIVIAPAGYGKSTLFANWASVDPRPFAWVWLDGQEDDNPVVFLRYIAAAVHRIEPLRPEVFDALSGPTASNLPIRIPQLLGNALAAVQEPLVLVLDDLHLAASPSCLDVLAMLVDSVPTGSKIVVASREQPALPVARWRAHGRVNEIGVGDLRLNEEEAALLLEGAGVKLETDEIAELTERTEGWPAGLYLAALSIQAGGTGPAGPENFNGDDRFISEYFRLELLSRMPAEDAQFLMRTSVLSRMCGHLCDAVLQTTGSAGRLDAIERANGFLVPLDRTSGWYRYHHLFGELLRDELERTEPDVVAELSARAMTWCIDNNLLEEAVVYAHEAGETDAVATLVDALGLQLYYDGRMGTVEEWLGWFSDEDLTRYPALAVFGAWFRVLTGRPDEAVRWLTLADGTTSAIALSDDSATIEPWVAALRAHMMPSGVEQALADAELALDQFSPHSAWRPTTHLARGVAHTLLGATDGATADFSAAIELGTAAGAAEEVYLANSMLALMAAEEGAWIEAAHRAGAALTLVEETGLGDYAPSALAYAATARVAIHEGRHDDARMALARVHRLRPMLDHGIPWLTIEVGLELTRAHLALTEAAAARTVLSETERVLELRPDLGILVAQARELREHVEATTGPAGAWAMSLTGAELRLLPYLATHLTFPEIATRLFISRNTVKSEAVSIYRKLTASSRSQAVERAIEVGLLENTIYPARANLTQNG